jgi:hypothetical protein
MHRYAALFATVAVLFTVRGTARASDATTCLLIVDATTYLEGPCTYSDDGDVVRVGASLTETSKHWAHIMRNPDGSAFGWWNGPDASEVAQTMIGELEARGRTCWVNERARVCFTPTLAPPAVTAIPSDGHEPEDLATKFEDESQSNNGPDFRSAFEESTNSASITCLFAEEELYAADMRVLLRSMSGRSYTGHIPRLREFVRTGDDGLTLNGNSHEIIWQEGASVAVRAMPQVAVASQMPGGMSQEHLAQLQWSLDFVQKRNGAATGLDQRVIILDFDAREAVVATLANNQLSQRQALGCQ